jgi:hypothetical protein
MRLAAHALLPAIRCGEGYDIRRYSQDFVVAGLKLRVINTQVAEQVNGLLKRVKTQVRCGALYVDCMSRSLPFHRRAQDVGPMSRGILCRLHTCGTTMQWTT